MANLKKRFSKRSPKDNDKRLPPSNLSANSLLKALHSLSESAVIFLTSFQLSRDISSSCRSLANSSRFSASSARKICKDIAMLESENTHRWGSATVRLTSSFTSLDSTASLHKKHIFFVGQVQYCLTGDQNQMYSDPSPNSECSLLEPMS